MDCMQRHGLTRDHLYGHVIGHNRRIILCQGYNMEEKEQDKTDQERLAQLLDEKTKIEKEIEQKHLDAGPGQGDKVAEQTDNPPSTAGILFELFTCSTKLFVLILIAALIVIFVLMFIYNPVIFMAE